MIIPVILSGGAGTRLWPLSRELYPKQLLPLVGEQTMLQQTAARLEGMLDIAGPMVVCNEEHRFLVAEQLRQVPGGCGPIILEPCGRNTAPAVAVAALQARADGSDPVLLVLPADHLIRQVESFRQAVTLGSALAEQGKLVTFGIVPDKPETGYGYIRADRACPLSVVNRPSQNAETTDHGPRTTDATAFAVAAFIEKPDQPTAEKYLASGDYFWNSGMFMFRASRYLEELEKFAPAMFTACRKAHGSRRADLDFLRLDAEAFAACPSDSIDYAVMEKTTAAVVIPLDAGWNDIGSWSALWDVGDKSPSGNVLRGDVLAEDVRDCYIHAENRLVAAIGVENLVVVETKDALLVAERSRVQDVKKVVDTLKKKERGEATLHRQVHRPWGNYESLNTGERFQVKRITVKPGASSSLQIHHHRSEHWVVVKGTARVTIGEQQQLISENESIFIPIGVSHRIENPGKLLLELIEVQTGSYLGEDDIVRIEDHYGRN